MIKSSISNTHLLEIGCMANSGLIASAQNAQPATMQPIKIPCQMRNGLATCVSIQNPTTAINIVHAVEIQLRSTPNSPAK